ncbi:sensor histidine kinase [Mesorhizobium sp. A623]
MKFFKGRPFAALPYLGMAAALGLSAWTFIQSDHYRQETDEILNQTYEIQWRATQIRERLLRVRGYLRLAQETGKLDPDTDRQMAILSVNVIVLQKLPYLHRFFPDRDVALLGKFRQMLEQKVAPVVQARANYGNALAAMTELEQAMYEISSATVGHSATLRQTAIIDTAASRNWFIFAAALGLGAILYLIIHQRYSFVSRRDQHMRSFASLFGHMTRSRVSALRLFLEHVRPDEPPGSELLEAARGTATELESINDSLLKIAYAPRDFRAELLGTLLEDVARDRRGLIQLSASAAARAQPVPAAPFRLLADELVENALTALTDTKNPRILIAASVKPHPFFRRSSLFFEVTDNGTGMTPAILEKATIPFFSTRAGNHAGLGLTACSQMVSTLKGKLAVKSSPGIGTTVQVKIPCQRPHGVETVRLWQRA